MEVNPLRAVLSCKVLCLAVIVLSLGLPALPAEASGRGGVFKAAASRMLAGDAAKRTTLTANRAAGAAAEVRAARNLLANGHTILGSQVSVRTPQGRRVIDHLIRSPSGRIIAAIEVKSGHAVRGSAQLAKDKAMASQGGIVVGRNAPAALRGKHMVIKTAERHH